MKLTTPLLMIIGGGVELALLAIPYSPRPFVLKYGVPFAWRTKWFDHFMSNEWYWQVNAVNLVADIAILTMILFVLFRTARRLSLL